MQVAYAKASSKKNRSSVSLSRGKLLDTVRRDLVEKHDGTIIFVDDTFCFGIACIADNSEHDFVVSA